MVDFEHVEEVMPKKNEHASRVSRFVEKYLSENVVRGAGGEMAEVSGVAVLKKEGKNCIVVFLYDKVPERASAPLEFEGMKVVYEVMPKEN